MAQHEAMGSGQGATGNPDLYYNPQPLRSQVDIDKENQSIKDFEKYFKVDAHGRTQMTPEGWKKYNERIISKLTHSYEPSRFKVFMDSLGAKKKTNNKFMPGTLGNLFAQYKKENSAGRYDTYHSTEFQRSVGGTDATNWKNQILSQSIGEDGNIKIPIVDFKGPQEGFKNTGDYLEGDMRNWDVASISSSRYGATARMFNEKDGKTVRVRIPMRNISTSAYEKAGIHFEQAAMYNDILKRGKRPVIKDGKIQKDNKGRMLVYDTPLTPEDIMVITRKKEEESWLGDQLIFGSVRATKNKDSESAEIQ